MNRFAFAALSALFLSSSTFAGVTEECQKALPKSRYATKIRSTDISEIVKKATDHYVSLMADKEVESDGVFTSRRLEAEKNIRNGTYVNGFVLQYSKNSQFVGYGIPFFDGAPDSAVIYYTDTEGNLLMAEEQTHQAVVHWICENYEK